MFKFEKSFVDQTEIKIKVNFIFVFRAPKIRLLPPQFLCYVCRLKKGKSLCSSLVIPNNNPIDFISNAYENYVFSSHLKCLSNSAIKLFCFHSFLVFDPSFLSYRLISRQQLRTLSILFINFAEFSRTEQIRNQKSNDD